MKVRLKYYACLYRGMITKEKVLKALAVETSRDQESKISSAQVLADRDFKDIWICDQINSASKSEDVKHSLSSHNWDLWLAYWLGREDGRQTALNNAKIYLTSECYSKEKISISRALLKGLLVGGF